MVDGDTTQDFPAAVRRAAPPHLLEYTWGDDLLRWELTPIAAGPRPTLRHTVTERGIAPFAAPVNLPARPPRLSGGRYA